MNPHSRQRVFWWTLCGVYVLVLYATLPLGRPLVTYMRAHLSQVQSPLVYGFFGLAFLGIVNYIIFNWKTFRPTAFVSFLVMLRLYLYECHGIQQYPEERLHFLEYGVIAILLHKACSIDLAEIAPKGMWPYIGALLLGCLIGLGDEGMQYLTIYIPDVCRYFGVTVGVNTFRRYFGWGDVWLNVIGVTYGLAFLATVLRNRKTPADAAVR